MGVGIVSHINMDTKGDGVKLHGNGLGVFFFSNFVSCFIFEFVQIHHACLADFFPFTRSMMSTTIMTAWS